jgi:apolipoprotein N-acyltransferase
MDASQPCALTIFVLTLTIKAMPNKETAPFRRAGTPVDVAAKPFALTWRGRVVLCLATVAALSLSFAPFKQFYLAWIALVPWLVMIGHAQSKKAVFFLSWLTGTLFFSVSMWWIAYVTLPGAMGLMLYMGIWFAFAGLILRGAGLLVIPDAIRPQAAWKPALCIVLIAAVWVATEWTWGNLFTGLPWLYLGHSQTPILAMCQIADFAGVHGVSFWVALINAWVALFILHRLNVATLIVPGIAIVVIVGLALGYGMFRMGQETLSPGPRVMVVQPDFPQDNSGSKGATYEQLLDFHLTTTQNAVKSLAAQGHAPDLVAWSETMLPELTQAFREYRHAYYFQTNNQNVGEFLDSVLQRVEQLASSEHINIIAGGHAMLPDRPKEGNPQWSRRNSSYLFDKTGHEYAERYDKIHLVPFGEYMPFRESCPPLYRIFDVFNPYKGQDYTVAPGSELTVFSIANAPDYRFVTPICFEDVDSELVARMLAGPGHTKRADFIVNLTNDGWFATPQMQQHLQLSVFRCIENRVPTARSVNTGISGFIDSVGRVHDTLPIHTTGTATAQLYLDRRVAPFTHLGDLFGKGCVLIGAGVVGMGIWKGMKNRRQKGR